MPADKYFPDAKEPHLHYHKGGVTFTDTRHRHKDLWPVIKRASPTAKPYSTT